MALDIPKNAEATSSAVPRSIPDMAGFCHGYELRRHRREHKANEGSLRCRADWETFIGPIERWGSCNPWEGHFGAVVLPFCKPERLAVLCYLNMDTDNIALDETEYRTVRSVLGTKQIQSKMLLELLSIDAPCAEVVIDSWKTMISTTAKQDKTRVFDNMDEYVDYRIVDTGAPFVDMLMRFGMGIRLSNEEQKMIEPLVRPCYAALGLANDYFSFDIEWEEFRREGDKTTMTNAYLRNLEEFAAGPGKERPHLLEYLKAEAYQIPGNVAWSLRCPRYHPELCEDAAALLRRDQSISIAPEGEASEDERAGVRSRSDSESDLSDASPTFWSGSSRSSHLLGPAEYISSLPSKGVREAFIDGLNVWLVLPDHRVNQLKGIARTLHNASLMLDDIEDHSPLRRGRPATHMVFGAEQTINSANYLLIDAMQKVRELGDPECMDIYIEEIRNLFVGQSFDLYWTRQGECPSEEEYLAMVRQKTGGLFRLLTRLMVQIAPVQKGLDEQLPSLSDTLGEFFQIRDDYKNLCSEYTGQKGFCEDLDECKFSFPLIHALRTQPKNVQLRGILQQSRSAGGLDVPLKEMVLQHLRNAGTLEYTEKKMRELMERISDGILEIERGSGVCNWVVRLLIHRLRILIVLSDANYFPLMKPVGSGEGSSNKIVEQPSGFFLMELAKPLQKLLDAGHEVTFASPKGREPQPDPNSESLLAFAGNFYERRRENELLERMKKENGFTAPRKLSSISDDELKSFAGVFIPGGHAPLADLGDDKDLGRILEYFHKENKPTAAICHGPYALLSTKASGGEFAYKGYKITCWSNAEEKVMESMLGGEVEKVETALMNAGAEMVEGAKEKVGQTTLHRELLTGGNPMAADELGNRFVRMISV
ncbi:isoprenoid synthase domain-containing protein [Aspergillus recurvatus]